ncbi:MAG: hypothetical protein ACYSW4_03420 [Planctomycetota bacterium]
MKTMKSKLVMCVTLLSLMAIVVPVIATAPTGPAGKSRIGFLSLVEKDPADWTIIEGGARGKMAYIRSGPEFLFVFNGHGLDPDREYVLIYYPDPWPGDGLIVLSEPDTPNKGGNLHIRGLVDTGGSLPAEYDDNYPDGAKIWLVLADDVAITNKMVRWNPTEYLFEYDLITFEEVD